MLERGLKLPTPDPLVALAKVLDVSASELFGEPRSGSWIEVVVTVAATIPKSLRPVALAILQAMAAQK